MEVLQISYVVAIEIGVVVERAGLQETVVEID